MAGTAVDGEKRGRTPHNPGPGAYCWLCREAKPGSGIRSGVVPAGSGRFFASANCRAGRLAFAGASRAFCARAWSPRGFLLCLTSSIRRLFRFLPALARTAGWFFAFFICSCRVFNIEKLLQHGLMHIHHPEPVAQKQCAATGHGVHALGRSRFGSVPKRADQAVLFHLPQGAIKGTGVIVPDTTLLQSLCQLVTVTRPALHLRQQVGSEHVAGQAVSLVGAPRLFPAIVVQDKPPLRYCIPVGIVNESRVNHHSTLNAQRSTLTK